MSVNTPRITSGSMSPAITHGRHHQLRPGAARRRGVRGAAGGRRHHREHGQIAVVESVKAASEIYAPVSGNVTAVNEALNDEPAGQPVGRRQGLVLQAGAFRPRELDGLMDADAYKKVSPNSTTQGRSEAHECAAATPGRPRPSGDNFVRRHIGPSEAETAAMLRARRYVPGSAGRAMPRRIIDRAPLALDGADRAEIRARIPALAAGTRSSSR